MTNWDTNMPTDVAERKLKIEAGSLSLDEMAKRISARIYRDERIIVRNPLARPIAYSAVYLNGESLVSA